MVGLRTLTYAVHDVVPYVSWVYFFHAWGFPPRFSSVSGVHGCEGCRRGWVESFAEGDRVRAEQALQLYRDALGMLSDLDGDGYKTRARFGLFSAVSDGDDVLVDRGDGERVRIALLRQQRVLHVGDPYLCLSDFVRPAGMGEVDTIGVFVAAADRDIERLYTEDERFAHLYGADEYRHMLCVTLADRLAEATAELMHLEVRRNFWGYAADEDLAIGDLLQERFVGIRPAVGYPSLPDQSLNFVLDGLIDFSSIGVGLTCNGAMQPHASVSGLLLSHPEARHFSVGVIGEDQLENYAQRRGMSVAELRKFLAGNIK